MIHAKHIKRRKFFLITDFVCICLAVYTSIYIRTNIHLPLFQGLLPTNAIQQNYSFFFTVIILSASFCFSGYLIGLYDLWNTSNPINWATKLILPNTLIVSIVFTGLYINKYFAFPSSLLVTLFIVNFLLSLIWRLVYFKIFDKEISQIILVGDKEKCLQFSEEFKKDSFSERINICAIFSQENTIESNFNDIKIMNINKFQEYSLLNPFCSVIIINTLNSQEKLFIEIFKAARSGIHVYTIPNHYEILLGRLKHIHVNDLPLLELKLDNSVSIYIIIKRFFDIIFSLILILFLSPLIILTSIIIKLTSPGPIFYSQSRIGRNSNEFRIFKFRSMIHNAEANTGETFASKDDPRVTKFGNFMRKTRIDEIPQLINILKGDMSFIGPRPERPIFVKKFENEIPAYSERTRIRPGITGLAQIHGDYNSTAETKLKYDLAYLVNQGLFLDLQIIIKTVKVIFLRKGQ